MKNRLVCILFIFFLAGCAMLEPKSATDNSTKAPLPQQDQDPELSAAYYYLEARIHIKNRKFNQAMTALEKAIDKDPQSFILTRDLIGLHLKIDDTSTAIELAEQFTRNNPDNVNGLLLLVQLKKDSFDKKELVATLNRILVLDPENKETFLRLGRIYLENEKDLEAKELFEEMTTQFPDYYVAWFYLGQVYLKEKNYALAKEKFLKTIELEPDLVEPRFQIIEIYEALDAKANKDKTIALYNDILKIEPENFQALLGTALYHYKDNNKDSAQKIFTSLGQNVDSSPQLVIVAFDEYISQKRNSDAVIIFSQMLAANPENSTLNFFTGMAYESVEQHKKAISYYQKVKPNHSQYKQSVLKTAYLYRDLNQNKTAVNFLEEKHNASPKDIDIISYLASFYEHDKHYDKAIDLLEKSLARIPDNTSLLFKLGAVQDQAGLKEQSFETMEKLLEIDPQDASALNYLGYSYTDLGIRLDEALDLIKRAHEIRPDDGYITDSLGWVYYKRGEYKTAVKYLEKAAKITSYETIISDHLGDAYQKINQFENALESYKKSVANATDDDKELIKKVKKKIQVLKKKLNE